MRASGADVYVTADLRHHPALEAREEARGGTPYLVDAGHWATESALARQRRASASRRACGCGGARALGWRPTSPHCAPTRGTSWSGPSAARRYVLKADPSRQWRLLDLQAIDTRLDQIAHAQQDPARSWRQLDRTSRPQATCSTTELVRARTELSDVQREVAKAESDVQLVRDRAARDQARLDSGTGTAKDLQAIQHELDSLARRQSELEDVELEVMERAEAVETDVARLEGKRK